MNTSLQDRIDDLIDYSEYLAQQKEDFCELMDCQPITRRFREEAWGHMFITTEVVCEKGERRHCCHARDFEKLEDELESVLRQIGELEETRKVVGEVA